MKFSNNMKLHIEKEYQFDIELVPPGCHCRNAAEVAICNFKAHILSVLAGTAESFPKYLWDCLLPHTEVTLNLLRQSNATTTKCLSRQWAAKCKFTRKRTNEEVGHIIHSTDGISTHRHNTTACITAISKRPKANVSPIRFNSTTKI